MAPHSRSGVLTTGLILIVFGVIFLAENLYAPFSAWRLIARYCERRAVIAAADPEARAFIDADGDPLQVETLPAYVRALRRIGVNAEFNGALCRGLLHARFDMETPLPARPEASAPQRKSERIRRCPK